MRVLKALFTFVVLLVALVFGTGGGCFAGYAVAAATARWTDPAGNTVILLCFLGGIAGAVAGLIGGMALARRLTRSSER